MRSICVVALAVVLSGCGKKDTGPAAVAEADLAIPAGPDRESDFNLQKAKLSSNGTVIVLNLEFKEAPLYTLSLAGDAIWPMVELGIDLDGNPQTGAALPGDARGGYELACRIISGAHGGEGQDYLAIWNAHYPGPSSGKFLSQWIYTPTPGAKLPGQMLPSFQELDARSRTMDTGPKVLVTIPYADIGAKAGQELRVTLRQLPHKGGESGPIADVVLKLK